MRKPNAKVWVLNASTKTQKYRSSSIPAEAFGVNSKIKINPLRTYFEIQIWREIQLFSQFSLKFIWDKVLLILDRGTIGGSSLQTSIIQQYQTLLFLKFTFELATWNLPILMFFFLQIQIVLQGMCFCCKYKECSSSFHRVKHYHFCKGSLGEYLTLWSQSMNLSHG